MIKLESSFSYLESFTNLETTPDLQKREYRLDRMTEICRMFGNPQKGMKFIHIAGSKGKGSVGAFIASVLTEAGYTTGFYSSPHIVSYKERIQIWSKETGDEVYIQILEKVREKIDSLSPDSLPGGPPTTFELLTLTAFLFYRELNCQWVVLETGMGGRLDATNVVVPRLSVITPIELEHTDYLGTTLPEIAAEKAGIIKTGTLVISSDQKKPVRDVLADKAREKEATLIFLDQKIQLEYAGVTQLSQKAKYTFLDNKTKWKLTLSMLGKKSCENSALALLALKTLFPEISKKTVKEGFRKAILPGRCQVIHQDPFILLDSAHTRESIKAVHNLFQTLKNKGPTVLIFSCVEGKDMEGMASILSTNYENVIISKPGLFKKSNPEAIHTHFLKRNPSCLLITDPLQALKTAFSLAGNNGSILVTGSFYLAGEILKAHKAVLNGK